VLGGVVSQQSFTVCLHLWIPRLEALTVSRVPQAEAGPERLGETLSDVAFRDTGRAIGADLDGASRQVTWHSQLLEFDSDFVTVAVSLHAIPFLSFEDTICLKIDIATNGFIGVLPSDHFPRLPARERGSAYWLDFRICTALSLLPEHAELIEQLTPNLLNDLQNPRIAERQLAIGAVQRHGKGRVNVDFE